MKRRHLLLLIALLAFVVMGFQIFTGEGGQSASAGGGDESLGQAMQDIETPSDVPPESGSTS